eukprot:900721-Pyramimonas_sp.AAC.1
MVHLLLHQLLLRMRGLYDAVVLRMLMDDTGRQWTGEDPKQSKVLFAAVKYFTQGAFELGLVIQAAKSGCVATTAAAKKVTALFVKRLRMKMYPHMRNLGHDLSGPKAKRVIEKKRMAGLMARKPKLRAL